jgi:phenylalanyl-tRNA synthetase beta chain
LYVDAPLRTEHKARRLLAVGYGYTEVHNYCWFNEKWIDALKLENHGVTDPALKPMEFANPSSTEHRFLRTTLMPNLFALVEKNRQFRDAFKLFEIGHIFFDNGPKSCLEKINLAGVVYQTAAAGSLEDLYRSVKGAVEDLGKIWFSKPAEFEIQDKALYPWQQPGAWIAIKIDGKIVGSLGYIEGDLLKTVVSEGGQVVWFEICLDDVNADVFPSMECQPIPVFPGSWADFSLVWPVDAGFGKLDKILSEFTHPLLVSRSFIGCYKGKGMEPGMGSYTFRTQIGAADHTLTGEEIEQFRAAWLDFLKEKGIALRS